MKLAGMLLITACLLTASLWLLRPALPDDPPVTLDGTDIKKIVVFGTSLSSAPHYSWPDELAKALESCNGTRPQIVRVTMPGGSSHWALQNIDAVSRAKPNLVIVEFAINDADLTDGLSLSDSRATHVKILTTLRARLPDAQILLMTTNPVSGLNWLKRYRIGSYFRLYSNLSREYQTGLIHMNPHWYGKSIPDGVHPRNGDASAVMVPQLLETTQQDGCASAG